MTSKSPCKHLFFMSSLFLLASFLSNVALALPFVYKDKDGGRLIVDVLETTCETTTSSRDLMVASFLEAYKRLPVLSTLRTVEVWRGFLEPACSKDLQDVKEGTSQGLTLMNLEGSQGVSIFRKEGTAELYLSSFTINGQAKRRGFGRCLLCGTIESVLEKEAQALERVNLVTRSTNLDAVAFYESMGFRRSDYTHAGYSAPDYIGMTLAREELRRFLDFCASLRVRPTDED